MKIVNLKREKPDMRDCEPCDYSWGLRINLCHEDLEKLGIDKLPAPGDVMTIAGATVVIAVRDDEGRKHMELQITDLGVGKSKRTGVAALYPSAADD